ncbi:MAG: Uma2 family endonuclease [Cyanobacteria bacterium J06638_28]
MNYATGHSIPQVDPPLPPWETLPTMYDLPSEFPEEPGLPDEFHNLQPQLLSRTLSLADYERENWFTGTDLNIYYDVHHPLWHQRPDWFIALNVSRLYEGHDLRNSYVVWQEGQSPTIVVEFLSPRTEREDLGRFYRDSDQVPAAGTNDQTPVMQTTPPNKFEVYEQYLRVPHYLVYSRYTQRLRYFKLTGTQYAEQATSTANPLIWLDDLKIGLGIWHGEFEGIPAQWLRWCDESGNWFLTDTEVAQQEAEAERLAKEQLQQEAVAAQQDAERLAEQLRVLGMNPDELSE